MSVWEWIADRTILAPTTRPVEHGASERIPLAANVEKQTGDARSESISFELWRLAFWAGKAEVVSDAAVPDSAQSQPDVPWAVLKFIGAGGRAERIGVHPLELWGVDHGMVYGVNPPGYGSSGGRARMRYLAAVAEQSWQYVRGVHPHSKMMVTGTSLGCVLALMVASRFPVQALLLRNPPPLHQMIRKRPRYNAWNLGAGRWVAQALPEVLNACVNAAQCVCPLLMVTSERDRQVPPRYQQLIFDSYQGPKQQFILAGCGHHDRIPPAQSNPYLAAVSWLRQASERITH